jgi:branched-chain amino acid transport system substrate-binding protein
MGIFQTLLASDVLNEITPASYPELDRVFLTAPWHPSIANEQSQAFIKAYEEIYINKPTSGAALTYDSFGLIFQAIKSQKQTDSESIRNGLATMGRYDGVTGAIEYRGSGDPVKSVAILQIKDGDFIFFKMVNP